MKMAYVVLMMLLSLYLVTGMLIVAIQELKRSYWRNSRKRPTSFLNEVKEINERRYVEILVSIKNTNEVKISRYYLDEFIYEDKDVEAWRPLPPMYKKGIKKVKNFIAKKRGK